MNRCSCGYATNCKDEFCVHLTESWDDLRVNHNIK
jgi:hypothetical protein